MLLAGFLLGLELSRERCIGPEVVGGMLGDVDVVLCVSWNRIGEFPALCTTSSASCIKPRMGHLSYFHYILKRQDALSGAL